ncbi:MULTISPECIES: POTRA domain-containing protein [unclassified Flavobacterium]|uniref:BamA/OMP85 family outer membrane protein n=1 Tax=unclassified Flavobacterium TaxID=196869 RepID=UPI001ACB258D|nr:MULTISPECIES: POTRA domain-containing protein [unclassified Flavobacterium]MBN9286233.1 BamA/TamA family outer membrane protein [Flavobacterium sp.]
MKQLSAIKKENVDLEKQANKLNNSQMLQKGIKLLFAILILGNISKINAQEHTEPETGRQYILADVDVTGKISYNQQTVVTFSGLEKGQMISVPGEEISNAIKKLWKLGLFNDINIYYNKIQGDSIYIELNIHELPKLQDVKITGVKKGKSEELIKDNDLKKGKVVNENLITTARNYIENKYKKDGYFNTKVTINTIPVDSTEANVNMVILVDRGKKVKVSDIEITGNSMMKTSAIKKAMSNTKVKNPFNPMRLFKTSKYIKDKYKEDLASVVEKYKEKGYRDARITSDTVTYNKEKNTVAIKFNVEEGKKYYFGDIRFLGNTVYTDRDLNRVLGINKGDIYNGKELQERIANKKSPDAEDLTNLYQNNGYLFSNINPVEVRTANDTIDFEIRIVEGPIAYFNNVTIKGNDKTNDYVIYRELRTRPGQKWNKQDVIRTIRDLGALQFFDPEAIHPEVKNADPASGSVDVEWTVVEKGSSQVELQGGYGGGGFIGTLGLSFNNFSIKNIFNRDAYKPLPMGDGQKMSLRLQGSSYFQTYSISFQEPWLGGKKPVSFSTSISHSKQFLYNYQTRDVTRNQSFNITTLSVGLAKRLNVPDDYFQLSHVLSFQYYDLNNYNTGLFTFGNGSSKNLTYTIGLTRNSKGFNPVYPTYGSEFSISGKFTLPYSLFNGVDYGDLGNQQAYKLKNNGAGYTNSTTGNYVPAGAYINSNGDAVTNYQDAAADQSLVDQKKFNWLEYYKVKFKADWYTTIYNKLVLRSLGEFGFLGAYNQNRGLVPFERFYLGGDGLANFSMDGREVIQLRGYPNQSLTPIIQEGPQKGQQSGGTIYNKFSLELRYPITMNPSASIYALSFLEAGASFDSFKSYNPFDLKRSAGFGLRVFMPAFGLLGIDFGYGFDALPGQTQKNGWETHFIIGQQF